MTGIWSRRDKKDISKSAMYEVLRSMEDVCQLASVLGEIWLEGDLLVDYSNKQFWGDDIDPKIVYGLTKLGFERK